MHAEEKNKGNGGKLLQSSPVCIVACYNAVSCFTSIFLLTVSILAFTSVTNPLQDPESPSYSRAMIQTTSLTGCILLVLEMYLAALLVPAPWQEDDNVTHLLWLMVNAFTCTNYILYVATLVIYTAEWRNEQVQLDPTQFLFLFLTFFYIPRLWAATVPILKMFKEDVKTEWREFKAATL